MTGNLKLLCNFIEKFLETVRFGNDQFAPILGYGDLVQGNVMINRVYYVEGLNHNLFSVGQFCDADLEVAFRKSTCFVRDLQGNDLLTGNHGSDLYTISLQESTSSTPLCLMAKASPTQAWLWHRRLSHLNFDHINLLSKKDVVIEFDDVRAPFNNRSSYFAFLGTNYQASATAFLRAPSLISVALLVRAAIPSLVRMLLELVRQHQVSMWLFHQTWLCSPYYSIMGDISYAVFDISYAVFVDSHRIPSSLLFLCGFLYRDPAGMAAQKPYSSTGAGLVLRGSNSKWYQGDVVVPSVFFMEGSIIQDILERRIDKCDEEMEIPEKSTNKSNMAMNVSVLSGPYLLMTDLHSQLMTLNDLRTLGGQACLRLGCFAVAWGIMVRRDRRAPHTAMPTAAFESIFGAERRVTIFTSSFGLINQTPIDWEMLKGSGLTGLEPAASA
nr:retrovirus-related Pol polyprotein from transposon TNT 1-94 [Tanacetum cinerariifolium]